MNSALLGQLGINEPWAILPQYAQMYYPALAALMRGDNVKTSDQEFSVQRMLNTPYFLNEEDLDDEDFDPAENKDFSQAEEGAVAIVQLNGPVVKYSQYCGPRGTVDIAADLKRADANPNFVGTVFKIESGGGQVYAIKLITDVMDQLKKPVVILAGNYLASAAYAIGIHAREIVADHPKGVIGSIGTMMSFQDVQPYFEQIGVKFHEVYASKSTLKNKRMKDALDGKYQSLIKDMLDPINEDFLADVRKMRSGKISEKDTRIFAGETFFSSEALQLGMIDHLGDLAFAVKRVRQLASNKNAPAATSQAAAHTSKTINNDMNFPNVNALAGVEDPSDEQLEQANAELTTAGITHSTIVRQSLINDAAAATSNARTLEARVVAITAERDTAQNAHKAAETSLATANANLVTANATIATLQTRIDALGKNPGAAHITSVTEDTAADESSDDTNAVLDSLPHNKNADRVLG